MRAHAIWSMPSIGPLLTVDGYGHTTILNPSTWADEYESAYLIDGTLPPEGAVCEQDEEPFALGP